MKTLKRILTIGFSWCIIFLTPYFFDNWWFLFGSIPFGIAAWAVIDDSISDGD